MPVCRSLTAGGRRCSSSHAAVRAAHRAVSAELGQQVTAAGPEHPAAGAYAEARRWAAKTKEAAAEGDEVRTHAYAANAKSSARSTRALLTCPQSATRRPDPVDPRLAFSRGPDQPAPPAPGPARLAELPEHVRCADALARASGAGGRATFIARDDGGQSVAWGQSGYCGVVTVYPPAEDEHPLARVAFSSLEADRYQALADSPWPYRVENGTVIYDRVPVDQAEQIVRAAATRQAGRPWERHGLQAGEDRERLGRQQVAALVPESQAWARQLNRDERSWISTYSGHAYTKINEHLFSGRSHEEEVESLHVPMTEVTHGLDSAIAKAARPDRPHTVYRGFTPPMEVRASDSVVGWARRAFPVGQDYQDASYLSATHCPEVAMRFAQDFWHDEHTRGFGNASHRVVFEIVSSRGAAVSDVAVAGNYERERLMPRNATYRVVGVQEDVRVDEHRAVVVQLVDVDDIPRL